MRTGAGTGKVETTAMELPRPRFTIRSMLAAVALSGILLATWLLIGRSRDVAARNECANNLRQVSLALLNCASSRDAFPTGTVVNPSLAPEQRLSWWVLIGGYISQGLNFLLDRNEPWDGGANRVPM